MKPTIFSVSLFGALFAASAVPLPAEQPSTITKPKEIPSLICAEITQKDESCIDLSFLDRTGRFCDLSCNADAVVNVTPKVSDFNVKFVNNHVFLTGNFVPETMYEIRMGKEFRSKQGSVPATDIVVMIRTKSLSPRLGFLTNGIIYPLNAKNFVLPFEARKVKEYKLRITRMYDNIPDMETYFSADKVNQYGEVIADEETIPIPTAEGGTKSVFFNLDLTKHLSGRKPGIYGIEIYDPQRDTDSWQWYDRGDSRLVAVTDMAASAVVDKVDSQMRIFVRSLSTGLPVDDASVRIISEKRQIAAEGTTKNGEALLRFKPEFRLERDTLSHAVIRKNGDTTILHLDRGSLDLPENQGAVLSGHPVAFVYAERDIMRPGETIYPSVFVREYRNGTSSPMKNAPLKFFLIDSLGKAIQTIPVQTDEYGFATHGITVDASAPTGEYRVLCGIEKDRPFGRFSFQVSTFMPDRIKVTLEPNATEVFEGEEVQFKQTAKYYFGQDLARPSWGFAVCFAGVYMPKHFEGWTVGIDETQIPMESAKSSGDYLSTKKVLKWDGYSNPSNQNTKPVQVLATLTVNEPGERAVSANRTIICHPSKNYIGIRKAEVTKGENAASTVLELVQLPAKADTPATAASPVELQLVRLTWDYNLKKSGGSYTRQWEQIETPVKSIPSVPAIGGTPVRLEFKDLPAGEYRLVARHKKMRTAFNFWHSAGEAGIRTEDPNRLVLRMDKAEYVPGETVRIEVDAPAPGYLFASFGEHNTENAFQVECKAGKNLLSIPIRANLESSVWNAAVTLVTGKNSDTARAFGYLRIPVDPRTRKLKPEVVLPAIARPSEKLNAEVRLSTPDGKPASGLVQVFAVDEGVLSLTGYHVPDIFKAFYGPKRWNSQIMDNFTDLYPDFKLLPDGSIGGDGSGSVLSKNLEEIRFKMSAVAIADPVRVPESGKASVTLNLPDHTGALRVMAVAANDTAAGSRESSMVIRAPVTALLSAPNAVSPKDEFEITCSVFNHDRPDGAFTATVTLPDQLESKAPLTVSGTLAKNDGKNFTIRCTAKEGSGSGDISVTLKMGDASHTGTIPVTVRPSSAYETRHVLKVLNPGETGEFTVNPKDWIRGKHSLNVSVSPAANLPLALNYLNEYPYGCLEQTVSRAFPYLAADSMVKSGMLSAEAAATAKERLNHSIGRILSMLRSDGSFTMWPASTHSWDEASIYAAHFLFEAKAKKLWNPDESVTDRIRAFLRKKATDWNSADENNGLRNAYVCYALAVAGDDAFLEPARNLLRRDETAYSSMIAALALIRGGYAAEGAAFLNEQLAREIWRDPVTLCGSQSKTSAYGMVLYLLLENVPRSPAAWPIAAELAKRLRPDSNAWGATQENAWAALGLGAFAADFPVSGDSELDITTGGKTAHRTFRGALAVPFTPGETVRLKNTGVSPLPVRLTSGGVPSALPATCGPIQITRVYQKEDGTPVTRIKHGEVLWIKLTVNAPESIRNFVLCDILPAGLEIEDNRLATRAGGKDFYSNDMYPDSIEKRFDRFLFFGSCGKGKNSLRYRVRAVTRGTFRLSPCTGENMYNPDERGVFSEDGVFTVE